MKKAILILLASFGINGVILASNHHKIKVFKQYQNPKDKKIDTTSTNKKLDLKNDTTSVKPKKRFPSLSHTSKQWGASGCANKKDVFK